MAHITIVATGGTRAPAVLDLIERFRADGHAVRLIASRNALRFLLSHLARRPWRWWSFLAHFRPYLLERIAYYRERLTRVPHVSEGKWADVMVMVPATCNSIGKLVAGISDNYPLLALRALPRSKRVVVVPSMNPEMWFDPMCQHNLDRLNASRKFRVLCPARGSMVSGDYGIGAQVPIDTIVSETYRTIGIADDEVRAVLEDVPVPTPRVWSDGTPPAPVAVVTRDRAGLAELRDGLDAHPRLRASWYTDGVDALGSIVARPPEVVVVDLDGGGGVRLLEQLRSRPETAEIVLIAVGSATRDVIGSERLGQLDVLYVPKPIEPSYLAGMVAGSVRGGRRATRPLRVRRLGVGEVLFRQGEPGRHVYVVRRGRVRVVREEGAGSVVLGTLGEGAIVGEVAFLGGAPRSATVEAVEPAELTELRLGALREHLESQPAWLGTLIESLIDHLRTADRRLADPEPARTPRAV